MIKLLSEFSEFLFSITKTKNLPVDGFLGIFLIRFVSPLGVMFHSKSSVCSFTPFVIFGPLVFFPSWHNENLVKTWTRCHCASFMMQIILKTIKMIRNKWIEAIWTSISFNGYFWISDGHFPMSLLKVFITCCLNDFKQSGVHFWPNLETFWKTSPNWEFFQKIDLTIFSPYSAQT